MIFIWMCEPFQNECLLWLRANIKFSMEFCQELLCIFSPKIIKFYFFRSSSLSAAIQSTLTLLMSFRLSYTFHMFFTAAIRNENYQTNLFISFDYDEHAIYMNDDCYWCTESIKCIYLVWKYEWWWNSKGSLKQCTTLQYLRKIKMILS